MTSEIIKEHRPAIGWGIFAVLCFFFSVMLQSPSHGQVINNTVALCDQANPGNCAKPNSAGAIPNMPYSSVTPWQWSTAGTPIAATTTVQMVAAAGTNIRNYLTMLTCSIVAGGVSGEVEVLDGSTVIADFDVTTNQLAIVTPGGVPLRGSSNTSMSVKTIGTTATVVCTATGYQAN